ncbi:MAG: GDSL-type esterase/lipase family protein [Opitutaceae bacterium]|jgi:lysophospholipase L1-like esterase
MPASINQPLPIAATPLARPEPSFILEATRQLVVSETLRVFGGRVDLALVGDSITGNWRWQPAMARLEAGRKVLNCGLGGDTTRNLLWRLDQGLLRGVQVSAISILIGLNNCWDEPAADEVVAGVRACALRIREEQPLAKIRLHALLPLRGGHKRWEPLTRAINEGLPAIAAEVGADFRDIGSLLRDETGEVPERLMPDGGHPAADAYERWADDLLAWLGPPVS